MKKPIYKRWWFIAIGIVIILGAIGASQSEETLTERAEREIEETTAKVSEEVQEKEQEESKKEVKEKIISPKDVEWNTKELYTNENGNLELAAQVLNKMENKDFEAHEPVLVDINTVLKAPWKYYGEFISFDAYVSTVQLYPPNGEISNLLAEGKDFTEIVLTDEDANVFINFFYIGDGSNIQEGELVTVIGLPCGLVDVENMMGGITTSLVVIGK